MKPPPASKISIAYIDTAMTSLALDAKEWETAETVTVGAYWSGEAAPVERHFTVRLLWSDTALHVLFKGNQSEPLVVSEKPVLTQKTIGLWDRDVCEIFIAPDREEPNRYFEFEIAPTGEWVDVAIHLTETERIADWDYASGMVSDVRVGPDKVTMAIRIPFTALGRSPQPGDIWLGNIFRCIGEGATRGYLAWQPTETAQASFHVPSAFGELEFVR